MNAYKTRPYIEKYEYRNDALPVYSHGFVPDTYLKLKPGEHGKLDIRIEFNQYEGNPAAKLIGHHSEILTSYYIVNTSDTKPKFMISRKPLGDL